MPGKSAEGDACRYNAHAVNDFLPVFNQNLFTARG